MNVLTRALGATAVILCLIAPSAHASVVIAGTRVVFDAGQGEATVRLMNHGTRPALVEAWIDAGNMEATPDSVHTPFLITPPLFRMNANQDQNLRILHVPGKQSLPNDRESIFWLNVLEIPPKPTGAAAQQNSLQFAIRSRIKLFYRPDSLSITRSKAPGKLTWETVTTDHGVALRVHNPTPYYITINKVALRVAGRNEDAKTGMVAPFGNLDLALPDVTGVPTADSAVTYSTLNDFGIATDHKGTATP